MLKFVSYKKYAFLLLAIFCMKPKLEASQVAQPAIAENQVQMPEQKAAMQPEAQSKKQKTFKDFVSLDPFANRVIGGRPYLFTNCPAHPDLEKKVAQVIEQQHHQIFCDPFTAEQSNNYVKNVIQQSLMYLMIDPEEHEIVGCMVLRRICTKKKKITKGLIEVLAIKQNQQGKNLGTAFLEQGEEYIKECGIGVACIEAVEDNEVAIHVYRDKRNFVQVDKQKTELGKHVLVFQKKLE